MPLENAGLEDMRLLRRDNLILLSGAAVAIMLAAPTPPGGILTLSEGETERDAILLECCDLPDKQLTLTEADLDGIVGSAARWRVAHPSGYGSG